MRTVRDVLTALDAGTMSLADVAADFHTRTWPAPRPATAAQAAGVADDDVPGDNTWALVNSWSTLTADQYRVLADAYLTAPRSD